MGISPENMANIMVLTYLHFRILKISHWQSSTKCGCQNGQAQRPASINLEADDLAAAELGHWRETLNMFRKHCYKPNYPLVN